MAATRLEVPVIVTGDRSPRRKVGLRMTAKKAFLALFLAAPIILTSGRLAAAERAEDGGGTQKGIVETCVYLKAE